MAKLAKHFFAHFQFIVIRFTIQCQVSLAITEIINTTVSLWIRLYMKILFFQFAFFRSTKKSPE